MNKVNSELNEYLNPLLTQLMGDSFDILNGLYQEGGLKELDITELEFFTKFIIDAREFYAGLPDRLSELDEINTYIHDLIKLKNNG